MKIHLLTGFLGSGKTTAAQQAAQYLIDRNIKTGIITNDQGSKLVDGGLFKHLDIPNREVINGCFCCNYNQLNENITSLAAAAGVEVIFAESVGSCTDIVATVLKPLLKFRKDVQVTVSTFADARLLWMMLHEEANAFDETVRYIYFKQLEEAAVIVVNKIDLLDERQLAALEDTMQKKYSDKLRLYQNTYNKHDIEHWLDTLNNYSANSAIASLNIDYDTYAEGEAKLAWVDQEIAIYSSDNNAMEQAIMLINKIFEAVKKKKYAIGHMKFLLNNSVKISFTSAHDQPAQITFEPSGYANLLINIRVQTIPENITMLVANAIKSIEKQSGCNITVSSSSAFQPGYPQPEHRM